ELLDVREEVPARTRLGVVGGRLVRVLAVGEIGHLPQRDRQLLRERLVGEPLRDRRVVLGGRGERPVGEPAPRLAANLAVLVQLGEHLLVLLPARDGGDVREVLRRGAEHGGTADVDHLDDLGLAHARPAGDGGERVEADADEVDRLDLVLGEGRRVLGQVAAREDPCVDARVERLDAAAEHLRRRRHGLDGRDRQLPFGQVRRRPARRDELPAELVEAAGERLDPRLVVDAQERARQSSFTTLGSRRCSTAWMRSTSVSRGSTRTSSCTSTGPVSSPSSTTWTVTPVVAAPAASASSIACAPGKAGSREGCTLTMRPGKRRRNERVSRCMYPARTTSSTPCSSSHVAITRSRSSRLAWQSSENVAVGTPASRARTSA